LYIFPGKGPIFEPFFICFLFYPLAGFSRGIYLKSKNLYYIMTKCLFCEAYCEVKCGVYCEGYPESSGEKEEEEGADLLGCFQIGTSYICESCLKDLKEALGIL